MSFVKLSVSKYCYKTKLISCKISKIKSLFAYAHFQLALEVAALSRQFCLKCKLKFFTRELNLKELLFKVPGEPISEIIPPFTKRTEVCSSAIDLKKFNYMPRRKNNALHISKNWKSVLLSVNIVTDLFPNNNWNSKRSKIYKSPGPQAKFNTVHKSDEPLLLAWFT